MADPYSGVSITGYNSNPPADDGSQTEANRVKWSTIKTKLNDPVKARTDDMDAALIAAFAKMLGGAGITNTSTSYTVLGADQGKLVRATNSGITITTPDATDVDAPFAFCILNDTTGDITLDGSGSQTVDGASSATIPAGCGVTVFTDGSNWFTAGQNFQRTLVKPQGYLTLLSLASSPLSPMPITDQSAKTSVFYRPFVGNLIPIPNGTTFSVREFSELTLTLNNPNHVAGGIYDVYVFSDSGALTIATGPAWTTNTAGSGARGTGAGSAELDTLKGLPVNKSQITGRNGSTTYTIDAKCGIMVGSVYMDATAGQVSCLPAYGQNRKWGVANVFNKLPVRLLMGDGTSSWSYSTATVRASNNTPSSYSASAFNAGSGTTCNGGVAFQSLADELVDIEFVQHVLCNVNNTTIRPQNAIGINSTTAASGRLGNGAGTQATVGVFHSDMTAKHSLPAFIGTNNICCLETINAAPSGTATWSGTQSNMMLAASWNA